jgi:hypothetical protein
VALSLVQELDRDADPFSQAGAHFARSLRCAGGCGANSRLPEKESKSKLARFNFFEQFFTVFYEANKKSNERRKSHSIFKGSITFLHPIAAGGGATTVPKGVKQTLPSLLPLRGVVLSLDSSQDG